ncbi:unnamed protein product [Lactuca saligna]|uniref:DC1 domain-containing protein n=1 Tax=Lactuca saligna TaxID=75948 RepID=A0AA35ZU48_LACSI|nr:unnamed protein product [Lactuca saligna]
MEQLEHFSHNHPLNLVQLQPNHHEEEEEEEDVDDLVVEDHHVGQCNMCEEDIYSFHLRYYTCKNCNYSLDKFCTEIPKLYKTTHYIILTTILPCPRDFQIQIFILVQIKNGLVVYAIISGITSSITIVPFANSVWT